MFRTTALTPQARRCSGMVAAAATAALILAPGAAYAAGQPAGPGEPSTSHSSGAGHAGSHKGGRTGHTSGRGAGHTSHSAGHAGSGHAGAGHAGTGHTGAGHSGTGHSGTGHSASHATGHAGRGHTAGHTAGHVAGHPASHKRGSRKTSSASEASTSGPVSDTGRPGASGRSGTSRMSGGAASDTPQNSDQLMADTVTRLTVSNVADDGTQTMTARVSQAHRTSGAPAPTGTVEFTVDGASSGPVPLSGGRAMVQVELGPGDHVATAKYSGDDEHAPSDSGPVSVSAA